MAIAQSISLRKWELQLSINTTTPLRAALTLRSQLLFHITYTIPVLRNPFQRSWDGCLLPSRFCFLGRYLRIYTISAKAESSNTSKSSRLSLFSGNIKRQNQRIKKLKIKNKFIVDLWCILDSSVYDGTSWHTSCSWKSILSSISVDSTVFSIRFQLVLMT